MKIAIPVDENNMETTICPSFGRAPYFLIYDTVYQDPEFLPNMASEAQGGAGIKAAQFLTEQNPDAILTPRMGQNASDVFKETSIKLYKTEGNNLKANLQLYDEGKLELLDNFHPGFHGRGDA
jgi:predicted Fe-Mo cluster-binding NifX family protein